jgi:hypothetical protein
MQAVVDRHHALVRRSAKQVIDDLLADARNGESQSPRPTAAEIRSREAYARRQARYEEAMTLIGKVLEDRRIRPIRPGLCAPPAGQLHLLEQHLDPVASCSPN